jgi:hypothetical protein
MRTSPSRWLVFAAIMTSATFLSACGGTDDLSKSDAGSPPPANQAQATPQKQNANNGNAAQRGSNRPGVNCGKTANGADLIAEETPAGTVGCEEAFNIYGEYLKAVQNDTENEGGTSHNLPVPGSDGWHCITETGAESNGTTACGDDQNRAFRTQQVS